MRLFTCVVKCRGFECGETLARATDIPGNEYTRICLSAPLNTPRCPKGCAPTFSDCNANSSLEWFEQVEGALRSVSPEIVVDAGREAA